MSQRDTKVIGNVYRISQIVAHKGLVTTCTAYNRNTNDVVGLFMVEVPPVFQPQTVQQILHPLAQRQSVQSPHILPLLDWGLDGSRAYIITAPPRGKTLRYVLDNEDINIQRVLDLAQQILYGLKALHTQGIAGTDLRPHLITVETTGIEDHVQLDDVGLRTILSSFGYTNNHQDDDFGSLDPRYASPEYLLNGPKGIWSDIYQVGLLLFEMATGRLPFTGRNTAETGVLQNNAPVPRMQSLKHDVPPALQALVEGALAKDPGQRFADVTTLLQALKGIQPFAVATYSAQSTQVGLQAQHGLTAEMTPIPDQPTIRPASNVQAETPLHDVPSKEGIYAYLSYEKDGVEVKSIPIKAKSVVVGRLDPKRGVSPDIDLSEFDPRMTISRLHARIQFEGDSFSIEDLKSRNRTRLGDLTLTPLKAEKIQHGDIVRFGSVSLAFKVSGMP